MALPPVREIGSAPSAVRAAQSEAVQQFERLELQNEQRMVQERADQGALYRLQRAKTQALWDVFKVGGWGCVTACGLFAAWWLISGRHR